MSVRWVRDLEWPTATGLPVTPSPDAWEDEVLYFLMLDRFSDGNEEGFRSPDSPPGRPPTPRYSPADNGNAVRTPQDAARWREAGRSWVGGTLAGVRSKLDYLADLGVTALWISPVLKQSGVAPGRQQNYHGYATQDFLAVDGHFGTADDLRELVDQAHRRGLRVILDVVLNHAGDVFAYQDGDPVYTGQEYPVAGWYDADRNLIPFTPEAAAESWPDGAVFPAELHAPDTFTRKGRIVDWETYPEYAHGDFETLKDINHGTGTDEDYQPSAALRTLTRAFCWWIAHTDLDGLRIDTVKHMEIGATRYFASSVHEFAHSIGKERFLLVGEILGSRAQAFRTLELTGLDAALGLADVQHQMEATAKGWAAPSGYFDLFRNATELGKDSHTWLRNTVVTSYDDHDMVFRGPDKARFCTDPDGPRLTLAVLALNVATLGIPCVYYGSEQCLDGAGGGADADRYIREAMFGGEFGAFRSRGRHVFDPDHPVYRGLAGLLAVRRAEPALRRGRQYLREISGDGSAFGYPTAPAGSRIRSVIAWSRLLADRELLCAINNDPDDTRATWVTVDADLHRPGDELRDLFHSAPWPHPPLRVEDVSGRRAVRVELPPGGVAVYGR